jgi:hypothetical protein
MAKLELTVDVAAPPERTFAVFTDLEKAPETVDGIVKLELLTEGPVGAGTRFRETRIMFKRECTEEMEITEFEPGERYAVEAETCGSHFRTVFTFAPSGEGTRVTMTTGTKALTFFAKLMSPLGGLMMGPVKKVMLADMEALKAAAEAGPAE